MPSSAVSPVVAVRRGTARGTQFELVILPCRLVEIKTPISLMNIEIQRMPVGLLAVIAIALAVSGCRNSFDGNPEASSIDKQTEREVTKRDLVIQLRDDFSRDDGPPDHFDMRWTRLQEGRSRTENVRRRSSW